MSENRSYHWTAVLTIVAMLGFAGFVVADSSSHQSTKVVPMAQDVKATKALKVTTADREATVPPTTNSSHPGNTPFAVPANDDCSGAIVIPAGPFPYVTAAADVTDATPSGVDEGLFTCAAVDATIWYSFTPAVSGQYIFSTCAGKGATGSSVYDTVISVFSSTGGACPQAGSLGCDDSTACGSVLPGAPYVDQGTVAAVLTAGNTYFVVAGHWADDVANGGSGIGPGLNKIAISVELSPAPSNDRCGPGGSSATPLTLDRIVFGTTASGTNDYRSTPNACFNGVGQLPTTSNGLDIVFSFVPPSNGNYSFRYVQDDSAAALRSQSPVLYLADSCPSPDPSGAAPPHCLFAANRMNDQTTGNGNRSEEIKCVPLTGGTPYYLFFDDGNTANAGGPLAVEVTRCVNETEPNDTIGTANTFAPNSSCFMEGSSVASGPTADIDFFSLGTPPAGAKLFVGVDGAAANQSDFEMRITDTTDTLGYDDNDGTSWTGSNAPAITGVFADGNPIYIRINSKPVVAGNEPYSIFSRIETGSAENESLPDPGATPATDNDTMYGATHVIGGGFVKGIIYGWDPLYGVADIDCFKFVAREGDNIVAFSDNNPTRVSGTITNVWPVIRTINGNPTPANTRFVGQVLRNIVLPSPGTLEGTTPSVTSEFMHYRARYTGAYAICYEPTQDVTTENPLPGAYPLPYQGSVSLNCGPVPPPCSDCDVSMTKAGPPNGTNTGAIVEYTITLTNHSTTGVAQDVALQDTLPPDIKYVSLTVADGFDGFNTGCVSLPTPGTNDAPIDCTNFSIDSGASVTYHLTVQVSNCLGAGADITNTASITAFTGDSNLSNNSGTWTFTTAEDGSCNDLLCDQSGCIANTCTVNDHCDAGGQCVSDARNCDDSNLCTDDTCDPFGRVTPEGVEFCVHDSTLQGDLCDDGNACTGDTCLPASFCYFPPVGAGASCNDFLNCTNADACDGLGNCIGHSLCDDGLPCTDDYGDEANNCACTNDISFPGTTCNDGNACTTGEVCDGSSGTAAACVGGTQLGCDDSNPCTDDSCDPASGCVHTANTAACDDGDVCTAGDTCGGGTCNAGAPRDCNDGNVCNGVETCSATGCVGGTPLNCDDGQCCTIDQCDPASGCFYTANTTGPVFTSQPSLGNTVLWPPNHGYADFTVASTGAAASSACGIASINFASCSSSQSENAVGTGDGNSTRDCVYAPGLLSVRAERDGACSPVGRVYQSQLVAVDVCGNATTSASFEIGVWHDRGNPPSGGTIVGGNGGTNATRTGSNGTYGSTCGSGSASVNGTMHDHSDADPEMEILQNAALTVDDLRLAKASGGNVQLTWNPPVQSGQVTRYHIWRLDPVTLFWTQITEVTRTTTSCMDPVLNDAAGFQYKISAVIK